jgi:predicted AlkP superfamily pyrophosphatase or phosphodiesterase
MRISTFRLVASLACLLAAPSAFPKSLLVISVDGMRPDYVTKADEHHLRIPNLRQMMKTGTFAEGVIGVVPTVTYPSHTTMMTGVPPAVHGIYSNTFFDPERKNLNGWYWFSEDIKVPTLWEAARRAGLTTASINWPVTVGAKIDYLIPEIWRAGTPEDLKLLRPLSTPNMLATLEEELGPYANELDATLANDVLRAKFAAAIVRKYKPKFTTVHLAALDHAEHLSGPFSEHANEVMEGDDKLVGELRDAALAADPEAVICVVSDHGFLPVTHHLNLSRAFMDANLFHASSHRTQFGVQTIDQWTAMPWNNGGSAAIVLKNPSDKAALDKVSALLNRLAADPKNGINRILDRKELERMGGFPTAQFLVDMKSGYQVEFSLDDPLLRQVPLSGTHGYLPEHPELRSSFFISGPGIAEAKDLGVIDMLQIAPTLANVMRVSLPDAHAAKLAIDSK